MKNIKDITISIFAIIGFVAIVSGFTNNETESQQMYGTPESHVWEMKISEGSLGNAMGLFALNKVTGEVKYLERGIVQKGQGGLKNLGRTFGLNSFKVREFKYGEYFDSDSKIISQTIE